FRYLNQMLDRELKRSQRYNGMLSIIFLDMDFFKNVNDTHGHLMGSKVLVEVGRILLRSLRIVDVIARYGGDEFVVVLPETSVRTGIRIAQRLLEEVQRHEFLKAEGISLHLAASFGVAGFPEHATTKRELFRVADQAMYLAKNGGRAQVCVAGKRTGKPRAIRKTGKKPVKKRVERRKTKVQKG
ncbi:MAG TPA: GGDEF domain-containing protein, partial [Nitrospiria bacterium]|nr:GGDEF domain-containing protein [Nitrospiria bacterium]